MKSIFLLLLYKVPDFTVYIQKFGYIGIYVWFITFDQITPLPEEISLLVIGYLVAHHIFNPFLAGGFSVLGFLTIDTIYYYLARSGSKFISKKINGPKPTFISNFKDRFKDHLPKTLFIVCFIPRMRLWAPIMIGSLKIPYKRFLLYDALSLCLFTTVYITLGIVFHASLESLTSRVKGLQHYIFFGSMALVAIVIIVFVIRRLNKKTDTSAAPTK